MIEYWNCLKSCRKPREMEDDKDSLSESSEDHSVEMFSKFS